MLFADALTLDAPRRTADGYLALRAKAARTGVYQYTGREVDPNNANGLRDQAVVNVLRDEQTVFDTAAARSFIGKPVTDDHPSVSVNASNWRDHSRGVVMGALRDGEYLSFDILLTDQALIDKVEAGKRDLSNGYGAELQFGDFKAPDGTACQARQSKITGGNHVAVVRDGRAGKDCSIATCDSAPQSFLDALKTQEKPVKTMLIDGLTVDISNADTAQATIATILSARDAANAKVTDLEKQVATLTTDKATLDAKIVTLEQAVKDAKPTPAQLRDAGKALMLAVGKAKALGVTVTDAMDETAIMKATVATKMGDKAKDWTDAQVEASFAVLTADIKPADPIRDAVSGGVVSIGDAEAAFADAQRKASDARRNAWKTPATSAAA